MGSRTWPSAWTLSFQSETSYNWETEKWTVPVNVAVAKLTTFGRLPVSLQAGVGYWCRTWRQRAGDTSAGSCPA